MKCIRCRAAEPYSGSIHCGACAESLKAEGRGVFYEPRRGSRA